MRTTSLRRSPLALSFGLFAACSTSGSGPKDAGSKHSLDAAACKGVPLVADAHAAATFCDLPGSLVFGAAGSACVVPGGLAAPSLSWLSLPSGFCAHYFAHVPSARQVRVAPGGELFVASPSNLTAGGAPAGIGAVVVLADDDGDGYADGDSLPHASNGPQNLPIFTRVSSVQGLAFATGSFYFQDATQIMKVPYASGQRTLGGAPESIIDVSTANGRYVSSDHWPKTVDVADDGTVYVGNGGDQSQACNPEVYPRPLLGGILQADGTKGGTPISQGFRNPISIRCQKGHDLCFAAELGLDGSGGAGGREKIVPIRKGDDWGYPCCATTNVPYADLPGTPDCSHVAGEGVALVIGDTPFGLDFEPGTWPAPYTNNMVVTLHGQVGSWIGARVLAVPTQSSGMPASSTDLDGGDIPTLASGWDDGSQAHGRPSAVAFSADGRVYIANDQVGDIFWIAPVGAVPAR